MNSAIVRFFLVCCLGAAGLLLSGCATMQPQPIDRPSAERLKQRARDWEDSGQRRKALLAYRALRAFSSGDSAVADRVKELQAELLEQAGQHFERGRRLLDQGRSEQARQAFMKALAAQPQHDKALAGLRRISRGRGRIAYALKTGEGPREVAAKVYSDPEKAFLVAYFLDHHSSRALSRSKSRTVLLPRLDFELKREELPEPEPRPAAAGSAYAEDGRSSSRDKGLASDAGSTASPAERYERALQLKQAGNSAAAYEAFSSLSPEYKDVRKQLAGIKERLNTEAEAHYKKGLRHFLADDLDQAIEEWQQALLLNPDHVQAKKSLHKARVLRKSLQEY
jgi:tetratricopeptide (TPR) repeat protein